MPASWSVKPLSYLGISAAELGCHEMKAVTGDETRTSITSSSDQEEACLQLAPGCAWTHFLVTPWLSLAPRTYRHPKCDGLPLSSCSDVKNIQTADVVLDCRQCSLRSRGRTGAFSRSLVCDCPQRRPTMGGRGTERNYFVCLPWPSDFFFSATQDGENTGLFPVWMEAVCCISAQRATGLA